MSSSQFSSVLKNFKILIALDNQEKVILSFTKLLWIVLTGTDDQDIKQADVMSHVALRASNR